MVTLSTELKYVGMAAGADLALGLARHFCVADPEYPVGSIRSIYYDNPRLRAFQHKIEGDSVKKKVRLRWYAPPTPLMEGEKLTAFIECKHRLGSARFKYRAALKVDRAWVEGVPLADSSCLEIVRRPDGLEEDAVPLDQHAVICIGYERHRFICPRTQTRVAVDSGIFVDRINRDLLPGVDLPSINVALVEFKDSGESELPWACHLRQAGFRLQSFSKYGTCLEMILNGGL